MRILLTYIHHPVSAPKFFKEALKGLGHDVVTAGRKMDGHLVWMPGYDFSKYKDVPDIEIDESIYPLESLLEKSGEVDMVIQMDANQFFVGKSPVPNVVYAIDNHVAKYDATDFDFFFGAHSWGHGSDKENFHWMPCAYSPKDHYPTKARIIYDAGFIGVIYENRKELIEKLSKVGKIAIGMGVLGEEYNNAYNQSRIGLCLSLCGDLPMRVFENAAQGLLVFADNQRDLEKLGMREGEHYVGFSSIDEAVDKFSYLMNHPKEVSVIAARGKDFLKEHTWESRAKSIISIVGGKREDIET